MRITRWNPIFLLLMSIVVPAGIPIGVAAAHPRPQDDALAEAARRAQAEKKTTPSTQKVWTNENIPTTPGTISVVGVLRASPADNAASGSATPAASAGNAAKPANSEGDRASLQAQLDAAKMDLNTAMTDLDILTRKQVLDSQSYYSKPNYSSDTAGASQLKDEQDEVDAKKQEVADAQKKVDDLQDQLNALGSDTGNGTSAPTNSNSPATTPAPPPNAPGGGATTPAGGSSTPPPNQTPG